MKKMKVSFLVFIFIGIFLIGPINALSPLHTEGRYIKDEFGNTVILHGVHYGTHINVPAGGWVPEGATNDEPWGYTTWDPDAIQYNLDKMTEYGVNALRIHMPTLERWYRNNVEAGGVDAPTVRDEIHYVIQEAEKRGIYVILCPWTLAYTESGEQTAIPFDYYNDSKGKYGPSGIYGPFTYGAQVGIHPTPEDFIDFWVGDVDSMHAEYGNYTNVIYELWNEVNGWVSGWDLEHAYFDVCQNIIDRLREKGDDHLVVYSFGYSGYLSNMAMDRGLVLNGTNIVYNIHAYRIHNGAQPPDQIPYTWHWRDAAYEYADVEARYLLTGIYGPASERGYYIQNVIDRNLPLINGEFGYHSQGADLELSLYGEDREAMWFYNTMKFLQNLGYGYTAFQWKHAGMIFTPFEDCNSTNPWIPPLNRGGQALINAINNVTTITTSSTTTTIPSGQVLISGQLLNATNSIQANVVVYNQGTSQVNTSDTADSEGNYSLAVWPDVYDLQYDIFYIPNFFIKLMSFNVFSNLQNVVNYIDKIDNSVSFTVDITEDQYLGFYSDEKPISIKTNGVKMTEGILPLSSNEWYYDSSENILYLIANPALPTTTTTTPATTTTVTVTTTTSPETTSSTTVPGGNTFGNTDVGKSSTYIYQHNIAGSKFSFSENGIVTGISVYLTSGGSGSREYSAMIYDSSLNFIARSRKSLTLPLSGWYNFSFSQELNSGDYWLLIWGEEEVPTTYIYYDSGSSNQWGLRYQIYNGVPDPLTWTIPQEDYKMSIYATYIAT